MPFEETINEAEKVSESLIGFYHFVDDDQQALTRQNWSTRTKAQFCKARGKGLHYPIADAGVGVDCVRERKPVMHNDYKSLPYRRGLPDGHAEVVRELVVPVMRGNKLKAILGVGNKPTDYSQKDVETMSLLADLVWEITERKQAERERLANLRFFESMDKVNQAIQKADGLEQMMKDVLDVVLSLLDAERVYLLHPCDPEAPTWTVPMERSKPGYAGSVYIQRLEMPMEPSMAEMLDVMMDVEGPVIFGPGSDHPMPAHVREHYGFQSMITMVLRPKVGKAWQFGVVQCSYARSWSSD